MNTSSENLLLIALSWYEIVIVSNFPTVTSDCSCKYQKSKGTKTFIDSLVFLKLSKEFSGPQVFACFGARPEVLQETAFLKMSNFCPLYDAWNQVWFQENLMERLREKLKVLILSPKIMRKLREKFKSVYFELRNGPFTPFWVKHFFFLRKKYSSLFSVYWIVTSCKKLEKVMNHCLNWVRDSFCCPNLMTTVIVVMDLKSFLKVNLFDVFY